MPDRIRDKVMTYTIHINTTYMMMMTVIPTYFHLDLPVPH
jgi:hypothetical protein